MTMVNLKSIKKEERETHIFIHPSDKLCEVFTSDFRLSDRLEKAGHSVDTEQDNSYGLNYLIPVKDVFRPLIRGR